MKRLADNLEMIRASKLGGIVPGVLISDEAISAIFTKKTLLGHECFNW